VGRLQQVGDGSVVLGDLEYDFFVDLLTF
jgi:hypothetical protein